MKICRKTVVGLMVLGMMAAAWMGGTSVVRAQPQVDASSQQIASVQDLAAVFKAVGKAVEPSVVKIDVSKTIKNPMHNFRDNDMLRRFFRDQDGDGEPDLPPGFQFEMPDSPEEYRQEGTGSGVVIEVDGNTGYILTNNHVAGNASEMEITLADGRQIKGATLIGTDPKSDVAVVKIEGSGLKAAHWGDSDKLERGDIVMAFGAPFGYVGSMTQGIVSALNRDRVGIIGSQFAYENFIQTDAAINPGNSGGPLVNLKGEVVGINTAIASRNGGFQGLGFAIPSNQAKFVYDALKSKGKVVRGWLGVGISNVAEDLKKAESKGWTQASGVMVDKLYNNTPAWGKLRESDIITSLNGKKIENVQELRTQIASAAPGTNATIGVFRDGKQQDVSVKLGEQPDDTHQIAMGGSQGESGGQAGMEKLGVRVAELSADLIQRYGLENGVKGAVVTTVQPGSIAQRAGLRAGDVITRIDDATISSPDDLNAALSKKDLSKGIGIYTTNREGSQYLFVRSDAKKE